MFKGNIKVLGGPDVAQAWCKALGIKDRHSLLLCVLPTVYVKDRVLQIVKNIDTIIFLHVQMVGFIFHM